MPEFMAWIEGLPQVEVDDVTYYVRGGDMLRDFNQVVCEWVRRFRPDLLDAGDEQSD
jgi:hypothetical protein